MNNPDQWLESEITRLREVLNDLRGDVWMAAKALRGAAGSSEAQKLKSAALLAAGRLEELVVQSKRRNDTAFSDSPNSQEDQ